MRISAVTPQSYDELLFDAGIIFTDLDYSSATDSESLYDLVLDAIPTTSCLGATRGGVEWKSSSTFSSIELDDIFVEIKGSKNKEATTVTISTTLTQFSPENAKRLINASDVEVVGGLTVLTERTSIDTSKDYIDSVVCVLRQGTNKYAVIEMYNCINTNEAGIKSANKGQAEMPITLVATSDDPAVTKVPYKITWFEPTVTRSFLKD